MSDSEKCRLGVTYNGDPRPIPIIRMYSVMLFDDVNMQSAWETYADARKGMHKFLLRARNDGADKEREEIRKTLVYAGTELLQNAKEIATEDGEDVESRAREIAAAELLGWAEIMASKDRDRQFAEKLRSMGIDIPE